MCSSENSNNDPFLNSEGNDQVAEGSEANQNTIGNSKEWKGVIYYICYPYFWIIFVLAGKKSFNKKKENFFSEDSNKTFIYGGYNLKKVVFEFFYGPSNAQNKDLNFIEKIALLLEPGNPEDRIIRKSEDLIRLHRVHENTKARKRLEKWASKVIVCYLIIVLCIVISNYMSISFPPPLSFLNKFSMSIPEEIMITILSTTTVNIIGLGLIVLRGHFLSKDDTNEINKKQNTSESDTQDEH